MRSFWNRSLLGPAAFTLVELIVVITVLAILWTVWFLSLWGYSSNARDSERLSDITNVAKSFDIGFVSAGSYPMPDNFFTVAYSGWTVWYQGTFGAGVQAKLGSNAINKRPLDPLKLAEYTYSSLAYGKAYALKADYEGVVQWPYLINEAFADPGNPKIALVKTNYAGILAGTQTGAVYYALAVPSILTNTGTVWATVDMAWTTLSGTLLFNGKALANASSFNPNVVVYSGSSVPSDDTGSGITNMVSNLKAAYQASDITSAPGVSQLLGTATGNVLSFGCVLINNSLGGKCMNGGIASGSSAGSNKTYATWNPSDMGPWLSLSNWNLTITASAQWTTWSIRSTIGKSSGKWYWEETQVNANSNTAGFMAFGGVGTSAANLSQFPGATTSSVGLLMQYNSWNNRLYGGGYSSYGSSYTAGDILGFALDMDAWTISVSKNGVSYGVMLSGLTGTYYPMVGAQAGGGYNYVSTTNFGQSPFTYAPPAGFNSGVYN